jgi:glycosyltransferase involved in cell wall biosynthesis
MCRQSSVADATVPEDRKTMPDQIAVVIPCYNEAVAIAQVVRQFAAALPQATVYVYDNNSTDDTARVAAAAGAVIRHEPHQGKGNVLRRMFADIDAEIYVMADGDGTYDAAMAPLMIQLLVRDHLDMVVGKREAATPDAAFRPGHRFGNRAMSWFVAWLFGERFTDIFSGYRVLSRRYVKSFPALATGFEIETELTVHALQLGLPVAEIPTAYHPRPEGSVSKLSTFGDGGRILGAILRLYKDVKPLRFFGTAAVVLMLAAAGLAWPLFVTYVETGLVPRFPTAILATGISLLAFLSLAAGVILHSVARGRLEAKRLAYLSSRSAG